MADYSEVVKAAIVKALKADGEYVAFVPKASVCGDTVPAGVSWPFSRIGSLVITPFRASGLSSSQFRINVQAFSKDVTDGAGTVLRPAASNVGLIAAALVGALDGRTQLMANGMRLRMTWVQSLPSIDGDEAGAWKVSCIFTGEVSA